MDSGINKCLCCYWCDQCGNEENPCSDFTPLNEQDDIDYYQNILKENIEEYDSFVKEMNE